MEKDSRRILAESPQHPGEVFPLGEFNAKRQAESCRTYARGLKELGKGEEDFIFIVESKDDDSAPYVVSIAEKKYYLERTSRNSRHDPATVR